MVECAVAGVARPCPSLPMYALVCMHMCYVVLCMQVQHLGGNTLSMLLAVATAAMGLLLWNNNGLFGGAATGNAAAKKLRSTEYTD